MGKLVDVDDLLKKQFFSLDDDGFGMMVVSVTDIISAPAVKINTSNCDGCKVKMNEEGKAK